MSRLKFAASGKPWTSGGSLEKIERLGWIGPFIPLILLKERLWISPIFGVDRRFFTHR